mmetsp:Transcript_21605/g.33004  ORF Transcript_21605/g.33004 Transcript_21605/m.33004 type:complete len:281 (-) Transcript_21605:141-983(-)
MVKDHVHTVSGFFNDLVDFMPPGLLLSFAAANIADRKYFDVYVKEFIGSMLMICFTFSAGKWVGVDSTPVAWTFHAIGVVAADYFGGGQQVNPAVTVCMWALGKCDYTETFVRIAGQMGGGLISFPIFHAISEALEWTPFGGPQFTQEANIEAAISEFTATFLLMWAIFILNWEINFGKFHYIIKQTLTAVAIRALIELFPTAGPAMNPMLATCWDVFGVSDGYDFPKENEHYFVYWLAPCVSALLAGIVYAIYAGDKFFGVSMPIGPLKSKTPPSKKTD